MTQLDPLPPGPLASGPFARPHRPSTWHGAAGGILDRVGLGDVVVFGGRLEPTPSATRLTPRPEHTLGPQRYAVLLHEGELTEHSEPTARLVCAQTPLSALENYAGGTVLGAAVPVERFNRGRLADAAELTRTPLVTASRAFLARLLTAFRSSSVLPAAAPTEEAVTGIVRAVLAENPTALRHIDDGDLKHRVLALIDRRHVDPEFDVDSIAAELAFSRRQLYRRVRAGVGIAELITQRRLSTARQLIRSRPSLPLLEIAQMAGFARPANMRAQFVAAYGMTPSQYRRSLVTDDAPVVVTRADDSAG